MKFSHIQQFFFFGLLLGASGVFLWMLGSYLLPVFWATIIAIVFYPVYERINRTVGGRSSLASLLTILAVILIVLIPVGVIGGLVVQESIAVYQSISEDESFTSSSLLAQAEFLLAYLEPFGVSQEAVTERIQGVVANLSQTVSSSLVSFGQSTFTFFIYVGVMLYLLFFFFRDAKKLQDTMIYYLPLDDTYERRLFSRFSDTSRAVVKGTLTIAILQGTIIGVTFWLAGMSSPVLWGLVIAILSLIPALGPALVWVPAGIILIASGSLVAGISILVVGALLVSLVDEFLRPILVGRGSKIPDAIIVLATIGGLASFGISGFVIGPIVAAFFLSLWIIFGERYEKELTTKGGR